MKPLVPSIQRLTVEAVILAGGRSSRMGRDKSRLRLGRTSLLGWVKRASVDAGFPVRVIRKDLIQPCGPLGGIVTALRKTKADGVLVLSCDMPFVQPEHLKKLHRTAFRFHRSVVTHDVFGPGFPCLLWRSDLETVETQVKKGKLSLHALAAVLNARSVRLRSQARWTLLNVNTPGDWAEAQACWRERLSVKHLSLPRIAPSVPSCLGSAP